MCDTSRRTPDTSWLLDRRFEITPPVLMCKHNNNTIRETAHQEKKNMEQGRESKDSTYTCWALPPSEAGCSPQRRACPVNGASEGRGKLIVMDNNGRPRLQRSASERGSLQRSTSLFGMLGRVPWSSNGNNDEYYSSSGEEEPAPPSPAVSQEAAKVIAFVRAFLFFGICARAAVAAAWCCCCCCCPVLFYIIVCIVVSCVVVVFVRALKYNSNNNNNNIKRLLDWWRAVGTICSVQQTLPITSSYHVYYCCTILLVADSCTPFNPVCTAAVPVYRSHRHTAAWYLLLYYSYCGTRATS